MTHALQWHRNAAIAIDRIFAPRQDQIEEVIAAHDPSADLLRECAKALATFVEFGRPGPFTPAYHDLDDDVVVFSCRSQSSAGYECVTAGDVRAIHAALARLAEAGIKP